MRHGQNHDALYETFQQNSLQMLSTIKMGPSGRAGDDSASARLQPYVERRSGLLAKPLTSVRLWMGQGNGWSHPISIPLEGKSQVPFLFFL